MLRLTLHQMRLSLGRLFAAGLAIALGTGFVAATLLASATIERTTYNAVTASYGDADLVVSGTDPPLDAAAIDRLRSSPGVAAADPVAQVGVELDTHGRSEWIALAPTPSDPRLSGNTYRSGHPPDAAGTIALQQSAADRLAVTVGDELTLTLQTWVPSAGADDDGTWETSTDSLRVTGILEDTSGFTFGSASAIAHPEDVTRWMRLQWGAEPTFAEAVVALDPGVDVDAARGGLATALPGTSVRTLEEVARDLTAQLSGNQALFTVVLLGFAAVSLAVAALVISNTFQVLVAQRTHTLALLRCVGASKVQVRSSVLVEALILGTVASVVGLALGTGTVVLGLQVLGGMNLDVPLATDVRLTVATVLAALVTGIAVTLLAALLPARMATRVAPLAALRPQAAPSSSAGLARAVLASVLVVGGVLLLAGGVLLARPGAQEVSSESTVLLALAMGVVGGFVSLCGLLLGAVFVVPALIRACSALLRGTPARIATANAVRNPRRTAATASALIIGVALVTMMSTGALSARNALGATLDTEFPVDVTVSVDDGAGDSGAGLSAGQIAVVEQTAGVAGTLLMRSAQIFLQTDDGQAGVVARAVAQGDVGTVLRDPSLIGGLTDDTVVVSSMTAQTYDVTDRQMLTLLPADGVSVERRAVVSDLGGYVVVLTPASLDALVGDTGVTTMWLRLEDGTPEASTVQDIRSALTDLSAGADDVAPVVAGAAVERAAYQEVIDTLLAVVIGLLAVAVVIALVGVANTLSLSVLERRRESALLRAMGLTRGQLRGMLALEGVLIAGVGALVGIVAGLVYGWAGSAIVLGALGDLRLDVPWRDLVIVAVVAVVAGLLASVLPARSAVRTPPVAALAMD